ncbi:hypothetical protein SAMN02990966_05945 [Rhodospirillales bacterium URHD0017]|nr:hypothetical protein SAMN02990966_05945 [Rhodospirillales bacterium URHD0017]
MNTEPQWPQFAPLESRLDGTRDANGNDDAGERLAALKADLHEAKARLREVLEALADKYDISAKDVSYAIDGFADDMLAELVFGVERDLEQAVDDRASASVEARG